MDVEVGVGEVVENVLLVVLENDDEVKQTVLIVMMIEAKYKTGI
jgi:hypothetical protein